MAYNIGFAQVTVRPVFTGFQTATKAHVRATMPAAGQLASSTMATGFSRAMGGAHKGIFIRAIEGAGAGMASALTAAGAPAAAGFVTKATTGLSSGLVGAKTAVQQAGAAMTATMTTAGATAGRGFRTSMLSTLGPLAAIFGIGTVIGGGAHRLMAFEDARVSLQALGHDAAAVELMMQNALDAVTGTPFAFDEAVTTAKGLVAAGIKPGEQLRKQLGLIADASIVARVPFEDMARIWDKIAAGDRIQMREINQLTDRGIPILQWFNETLGTTTMQTRELSRKGELNFALFAQAVEEHIGGASQAAADTTRGAFDNLKISLQRFGAELLTMLGFGDAKTFLMDLRNGIDDFTTTLKKNEPIVRAFALGVVGVVTAFTGLKILAGIFGVIFAHPILAALSLVAGGLIYLWENNETFRTKVTEAWDNIKTTISDAWENSIKPTLEKAKTWIDETFRPALENVWSIITTGKLPEVETPQYTGGMRGDWENEPYVAPEGALGALMTVRETLVRIWNNDILPVFENIRSWVEDTLGPIFTAFVDNYFTPAWEGIERLFAIVWTQTLYPILQDLWAWINERLIPMLVNFYNNVVEPIFSMIGNVIAYVWENVIQPAFAGIRWFIENILGPLFQWFLDYIIIPVWKAVSFAIEVAWNIIKLVFDLFVWTMNEYLIPTFLRVRDDLAAAWNYVAERFEQTWNDWIKPIFDAVGSFITEHVAPAFQEGVDLIAEIWAGLQRAAAVPVNFVIESVYTNGIKKLFDNIARAVGSSARLPDVDPVTWGQRGVGGGSSTGRMQFRARGGYTHPGMVIVGENGPELLDLHTPGRVYTAAQLRALSGSQDPEDLKAAAGSRFSDAILPMGDGWLSTISNSFKQATSWIRGALANTADLVLTPIRAALKAVLPDEGFAGLIRGAMTKSIGFLVDWIRGHDAEATPEDFLAMPELMGSGWFRPSKGRLTSLFGSRWGGFHNGIDFGGRLPVYAARDGIVVKTGLNSGYGNTGYGVRLAHGAGLETYYGHAELGDIRVARGDRVKAGQWISMGGNSGNSTGNHLHFSVFRNGKALNPASFGIYDDGGWLPQGVQAVANLTRQPEAVLTGSQWDDIHRLALESAEGGRFLWTGDVLIDPKDLDGLRSIEDFANNARRRRRAGGGVR